MLITAINDVVKDMVVTDPAAGLLAPGASECVFWIGANVVQVDAVVGIEECSDALREVGTPGAAYGAEMPGGGASSNVVVAAGAPTVTDDDVAVAYGASFNVDGTSITPIVKAAILRYIEENVNA
jgi:hypothetical protein